MKIKVGVMGSAGELAPSKAKASLAGKAANLARTISQLDIVLLTGATTGLVYLVGKSAHDAGIYHVGISPAENKTEHVKRFKLPVDACDLILYTGFGLKGRNVVLVRSCDIVLFIAGAMGSLNEFSIAHDEGKIIGCLTNTGGVADEAHYLLRKFSKETGAVVFHDSDPQKLLEVCLDALKRR